MNHVCVFVKESQRQHDKPPRARHHSGVPAPFSSSSDPITHHSTESIHQSGRTAAADTFTAAHVCLLLVVDNQAQIT